MSLNSREVSAARETIIVSDQRDAEEAPMPLSPVQQARARSLSRPPSKIPEDAEIIDVDNISDVELVHVKTEVPDVTFIKEEPLDVPFNWNLLNTFANPYLIDSGEDHLPLQCSPPEAPVKAEQDDSMDVLHEGGPVMNPSGHSFEDEVNAGSLQCSALETLVNAEKEDTMDVLHDGGPVADPGGHSLEDDVTAGSPPLPEQLGSLFSKEAREKLEAQKYHVQEALPEATVPSRHDDLEYGDEDFTDDELDHAAIFDDLKRAYEMKKAKGETDWDDEVRFLKAENAENSRLRRLVNQKRREEVETAKAFAGPHGDASNLPQGKDTLFVDEPEDAPTPEDWGDADYEYEENVNDDVAMDDPDGVGGRRKARTEKPRERKEVGQRKPKIRKADLDASIAVGMEADMAKQKKRVNPSSEKTPKKKKAKTNAKSAERKIKDPKAKVTKVDRGKTKAKKSKDKAQPMLNLGGLTGNPSDYNMFEAANHNVGKTNLSAVNETRKADQLKALLASVPENDLRSAHVDIKHIRNATVQLFRRNIRPAPGGEWRMRGMRLPLKNHQVLGAAWMKERETGAETPNGGLLADEMGLGKTVMMLSLMVANKPLPDNPFKTTLIVASQDLCEQWMGEMEKHVDGGVLEYIKHMSGSRVEGSAALASMQRVDVVFTTYSEVLRSYPKYAPPKDIVSSEKKQEWWRDYYQREKGVLHQMHFYRVILDEAAAIKNHLSKTENFCPASSMSAQRRLQSFLRLVMCRRTHGDQLLGQPIVELPENSQRTRVIQFHEVERKIYDIVRTRFMRKINTYHQAGTLKKKSSNILTMVLRLRQLTAHPFLVQETIEELIEAEDVEALWQCTSSEENSGSYPQKIVHQMQQMLLEKSLNDQNATEETVITRDELEARAAADTSNEGLFRFRKFLRGLREQSAWEDIENRSLCHRCHERPDQPCFSSCYHIYCRECLFGLQNEATFVGETEVGCAACGQRFDIAKALQSPCEGLQELGWGRVQTRSSDNTQQGVGQQQQSKQKDREKWLEYEGEVLQSAKTRALVVQLDMWFAQKPNEKVIIFTQFQMMIAVISRICKEKDWGYCEYHGKMKTKARVNAIQQFGADPEKKILIASLKAGGIGLNLTMASRVICVDLWWNSATEEQAFCRVFRIGQTSETMFVRFVVKDTIDEKLEKMQDLLNLLLTKTDSRQ